MPHYEVSSPFPDLTAIRVFVYGTLRSGQKNFSSFLDGRIVTSVPATIDGRLYFVEDGGYPYLLPESGKVIGELVFLDPRHGEATLRDLDALEEYDPDNEADSVYLRRRAVVTMTNGEQVSAWTYFWNCPGVTGVWIKSGDFLDREGVLEEK